MRRLNVAIVGSGPAGFYAAAALLSQPQVEARVDVLERLPTPWGLVRAGVAPDHPKIKSVSRVYEKTAAHERVRFFGNVELGRDIQRDDLLRRYDAVVYAVGSATDRRLDVPGEDLPGSWAATDFVGWYNGHPDYRDLKFDLDCERAVVIGNGNVAVDVARMLCLPEEELRATDVADHALEVLASSQIREIVMVGRRGPAQAAFTTPELRELGELSDADIIVDPEELRAGTSATDAAHTATAKRNVELLREYAARPPTGGKPKRIVLRFLRSPIELRGNGRVHEIVLGRNELQEREGGRLSPRDTGERERLTAGLIFRAVGYRGAAIDSVPFDDERGVIPNDRGRVLGGEREYVVGWIKRGPTGIIGTNKKDAQETVGRLCEDAAAGTLGDEPRANPEELYTWLRERQPELVTEQAWQAIDRHQRSVAKPQRRPRVKLCTVPELLGIARSVNAVSARR